MVEIQLEIPRTPNHPNPISLPLKNGDQLFIVGPNGSGKSALMQQFSQNYGGKWITAHRQTWISSARHDLTPEGRQRSGRNRAISRTSDSNSGVDWSNILYDLEAQENAIEKSIAQHVRAGNILEAEKIAVESPLPFDQMNELLGLGGLKVTLEKTEDGSIRARYPQRNSFSAIDMSDGERNAMILAGHVITAGSGTIFLIDEPERHLHRSITQPFLSALFDLRSEDCAFIIATHEIDLPVGNPDAQVLMLRSCQWGGGVAWDAEILKSNDQLPEELKRAILGSRKRILFVEGDSDNSLDFPLYTTLFPDISVIPKGSCEEVQKAVLGVRGSSDLHDVEAFGLIDRDNREDEDVKRLEEKGVFALEVYSAEALYYCSDAITAVASRQAESLGEEKNKFIESARQEAIQGLDEEADRMVARRCERRTRELLLSKIPDWKSIQANPTQPIGISVDSPYPEEHNRFKEHVQRKELDQLIARYPVRESRTFKIIARSLKCRSKTDYERMVIARVQCDDGLVEKLKKRIGPLSLKLDQIENPETINHI